MSYSARNQQRVAILIAYNWWTETIQRRSRVTIHLSSLSFLGRPLPLIDCLFRYGLTSTWHSLVETEQTLPDEQNLCNALESPQLLRFVSLSISVLNIEVAIRAPRGKPLALPAHAAQQRLRKYQSLYLKHQLSTDKRKLQAYTFSLLTTREATVYS